MSNKTVFKMIKNSRKFVIENVYIIKYLLNIACFVYETESFKHHIDYVININNNREIKYILSK